MKHKVYLLSHKNSSEKVCLTSTQNNFFRIGKQKATLNYLTIFLLLLIILCSSCSKAHRDKEIKADLTTKAKNELNFAGVNYMVEDGVVTLTGKCSSEKSKNEVEQDVKGINIVKGIINKIVVAPVTLTSDFPLKQAADSVLKNYPGAEADVSGNTIVLEGKAAQKDVDKILPALNKLHPNKIDNRLKLE
ncbi:BON domain-containing protein [Mucilaginibacter arboris]|uniref:BON domain-containing protein n=1 Tax=Mucilaginibacter arboris TaxID=2682090 RepID=A0A7K1SZW6_9SPHI|nr:BON domain-containing protein [Mucilaginibacter arboris]MVN22849.1 BON domain-containing protein [Mucilaginibacter arboris]